MYIFYAEPANICALFLSFLRSTYNNHVSISLNASTSLHEHSKLKNEKRKVCFINLHFYIYENFVYVRILFLPGN